MNIFNRPAKWFLSFAFAALLVTGTFTGCENTNNSSTPGITQQTNNPLAGTMAIQDRHTDDLLAIDGVIGTGTGVNEDGSPAIYIFTSRDNVAGLPSSIEGIRTRIQNAGIIEAGIPSVLGGVNNKENGGVVQAGFTGTYRNPLWSGVSVCNDNECASGTIGCVVADNATGTHRYFLSNNHVFARVNAASIGERIDQPGRYDAIPQCAQTGQVASLSKFIPINFKRGTSNIVDCAIAEVSGGDGQTSQMALGTYTPTANPLTATVGLNVKKSGRTTGFTTGTISAINVTVTVSYGRGKNAKFVNQIYINSSIFSAAGDSGSLIVEDASNDPVGLLFAGSSTSTIANPIGDVLGQLAVTIVPN